MLLLLLLLLLQPMDIRGGTPHGYKPWPPPRSWCFMCVFVKFVKPHPPNRRGSQRRPGRLPVEAGRPCGVRGGTHGGRCGGWYEIVVRERHEDSTRPVRWWHESGTRAVRGWCESGLCESWDAPCEPVDVSWHLQIKTGTERLGEVVAVLVYQVVALQCPTRKQPGRGLSGSGAMRCIFILFFGVVFFWGGEGVTTRASSYCWLMARKRARLASARETSRGGNLARTRRPPMDSVLRVGGAGDVGGTRVVRGWYEGGTGGGSSRQRRTSMT